MSLARLFWVPLFGLLVFGCKPSTEVPAPAPPSKAEASWVEERDALKQQIAALDAEADRVTRELVQVKVERDQLKRELNVLSRRAGCER